MAIGPVARLMTRDCTLCLIQESVGPRQWQALPLLDEARAEILFWNTGQNIWVGPSTLRVVYTDASDSGYAGYTVHHGCHIAQGPWSDEEAAKSFTWRELKAVRLVLEALESKLTNERVR